MFEVFDHTADLGLRVEARNLDELFNEAARGLFAQLLHDPQRVTAEHRCEFSLVATRCEYLLVDWLNELLYSFETQRMLFCQFDVQVSGTRLIGRAWGEPIDARRHPLASEVKGVTYHGLAVESCPQGWRAELILDV